MNTNTIPQKTGVFSKISITAKKWMQFFSSPANQIRESDAYLFGATPTTVASLLGSGRRQARNRNQIYEKWAEMECSPIISTALSILITSALGGHETTGDLVFIEPSSEARKNTKLEKIADEIRCDLTPLFNRIAFQVAYTGAAFGDAFARVYADESGIVDLYVDELVRPQLVQPFERGSRTVGYAVYTGERNFHRLDAMQMVRLKMPRTQWVPQGGVVEKSLRLSIAEDDINNLPLMPAMAGGSFLFNAEEPYDNLNSALIGIVGQRWIDSIDEQIMTINVDSMTKEQRTLFLGSIETILKKSKDYAEKAVKEGRPILERIRHVLPVFGEKQMANLTPTGAQSGRAGAIAIDDVMLHAKLLSGALGVDLSMLGFADQLSGGLGDGGFFRVSAQIAERARVIRAALSEFFKQIIDIHTMHKYGIVFSAGEWPFSINFYGSISAMEAEKQRTRADAMNGGMLIAQSLQLMKEIVGNNKEIMREFLSKSMMLDEEQAKLFANIVDVPPPDDGGGNQEQQQPEPTEEVEP